MSGYLRMNKDQRSNYEHLKYRTMKKKVDEITKYLKYGIKNDYWLNRLESCKTLSGKYEIAKKIKVV